MKTLDTNQLVTAFLIPSPLPFSHLSPFSCRSYRSPRFYFILLIVVIIIITLNTKHAAKRLKPFLARE